MILGIKTTAVFVSDPAAALSFWTEKLGFELRRRSGMRSGEWVEIAPPGADSHIVLYPRSMMPNWGELRPSIVFACQNVQQTVNELRARGVLVPWGPEKLAFGTFARFADPDGNEFLLGEA